MFKKVLLSAGAISTSTIPLFSLGASTLPNKILFDGLVFESKEEVVKYMMDKKFIKVNKQNVIGDLGNSYSNYDLGTLNKSKLPNFDSSKAEFAWEKADGSLTRNYDEARNTYFNEGLSNIKYSDGFGDYFLTQNEAYLSASSKVTGIYNANLELPLYKDGVFLKNVDINPLNEEDVKNVKNNILENIESLLIKQLSNDYTFNNEGYEIVLVNENNEEVKSHEINDISKNIKPSDIDRWTNQDVSSNIDEENNDKNFKSENLENSEFSFSTKKMLIGNGFENENVTMNFRNSWVRNKTYFLEVEEGNNFDFDNNDTLIKNGNWSSANEQDHFKMQNNGDKARVNFNKPAKIVGTYNEINTYLNNPETYLGFYGQSSEGKTMNTSFDKYMAKNLFKDKGFSNVHITEKDHAKVINGYINDNMNGISNMVLNNKILKDHLNLVSDFSIDYYFYFNKLKVDRSADGFGWNNNRMWIRDFEDKHLGTILNGDFLKINGEDHNKSKLLKQIYNTKEEEKYKFVIKNNNNILFKLDYNNGKYEILENKNISNMDFNTLFDSLMGIVKKEETFSPLWKQDLTNQIAELGRFIPILDEKYTYKNILIEYWYNMANMFKNNSYGNKSEEIFNRVYTPIEKMLIIKENKNLYSFSRQVIRKIEEYNPNYYDNSNIYINIKTEEEYLNKVDNSIPLPVAKYIFYNINGEQIDYDESTFDSFETMKANILSRITPKKNPRYLYLEGIEEPVYNSTHSIYEAKIFANTLYFASYEKMINYIYNVYREYVLFI